MMKLKVDLECCKCYKKVKKVLCKFPQIRDTIFDEKSHTVIIKVVCCSPEKIMDKLCCKGGGSIKTIETIEPPKPPPKAQPKPNTEKPKPEVEKPPAAKPDPAKAPPPKQPDRPPQPQPQPTCCGQCYEGRGGGPCFNGYGMQAQPYECYGRPVYDSWGGGPPPCRPCHVSRCDYCSEDNPQNCCIM